MQRKLLNLLILCLLTAASVSAEDGIIAGGHLKAQASYLDEINGGGSGMVEYLDGRLKQAGSIDAVRLEAHEELLAASSTRSVGSLFGQSTTRLLATDRYRLLRLTDTFTDSPHGEGVIRFDRLSAGWSNDAVSVVAGRQAYSLGSGLAFSVMDFLNPFSPLAVDKDYKPGDDMLTARFHLLEAGDTEIVVAPKRSLKTEEVEDDASSGIINQKLRIDAALLDAVVLTGVQDGHFIYGAGASRDLFGATFRSDLVMHQYSSGESRASFLVNGDAGFECLSRNCYLFAEYFHSGVGTSRRNYYLPDRRRDEMLSYGELFTLGRNYTAEGFRIEATPLLNIYLTHLMNLQDSSSMIQPRAVWDLYQDVIFQFGATIPCGGMGDEFGGSADFLRTGLKKSTDIFLRLEYYF